MSNVMMTKEGAVPLPPELLQKHGFNLETPIRIIEIRSGLLLIPLTKTPMSAELAQELAEWQSLSVLNGDAFPYEDTPT